MDPNLISRLKHWFTDGLTVDGWVEQDDNNGHMYIDLFPYAVQSLKLRRGDYVRIQVIRKEDTNENLRSTEPPDTGGGLSSRLSNRPALGNS